MNDPFSIWEDSGSGFLELNSGDKLPSDFKVSQHPEYGVSILCTMDNDAFSHFNSVENPRELTGETSNGEFKIKTEGELFCTFREFKPQNNRSTGQFYPQVFILEIDKHGDSCRSHYGLTNFYFYGTDPKPTGRELPLKLPTAHGDINVRIVPVGHSGETRIGPDYPSRVELTCEAIIDHPTGIPDVLDEVIDNLCHIMSIARGTRVQWIYRRQTNESNKESRIVRLSRSGTPYSGLPLLHPIDGSGHHTRSFLERLYPEYEAIRDDFKLNKGLIDAFLEARVAHTTERRGIIIATMIEMFKHVAINSGKFQIKSKIMTNSTFNRVKPNLCEAIRQVLSSTLEETQITLVTDKIEEFNRKTFNSVLTEILDHINLSIPDDELDLFISCRNKLIHTGYFHKPENWQKLFYRPEDCSGALKDSEIEQSVYFFMLNFMDKCILKLLNYSGPYLNWKVLSDQHPGAPQREELS